jgi:hypothetical protein
MAVFYGILATVVGWVKFWAALNKIYTFGNYVSVQFYGLDDFSYIQGPVPNAWFYTGQVNLGHVYQNLATSMLTNFHPPIYNKAKSTSNYAAFYTKSPDCKFK